MALYLDICSGSKTGKIRRLKTTIDPFAVGLVSTIPVTMTNLPFALKAK